MTSNSGTSSTSSSSSNTNTTSTTASKFRCIDHLEPAITPEDVKAANVTWLDNQVKKELLNLAKKFLEYDLECELWEPEDYDPFTVSLSMLEERLLNGKFEPSSQVSGSRIPSPADIMRVRANVNKRTGKSAMNRPLEEFQDLYHALVAKVKEVHSQICVQVNNGFMSASAVVWYEGPSLEWFAEELVEFWDTLNDPEVVQPLDDAVRRSNAKDMHTKMLNDHLAGKLSAEDLKNLSEDLYEEPTYGTIAGLEGTGHWAPAMIYGWLTEKYRILLLVEHDAEARQANKEKKEKQRQAELAREAPQKKEAKMQRKKEEQQQQQEAVRKLEEEKKRKEEHEQEIKRQAEAGKKTRHAFDDLMAATREKMQQEREAREWAEKARRVQEYGRQLRAFCNGSECYGANGPVTPLVGWPNRIIT